MSKHNLAWLYSFSFGNRHNGFSYSYRSYGYTYRNCEDTERAELQRQLEMEKLFNSGRGQNYIEGHYEYIKKKKWGDTSRKERVWVNEHYEGNRKVEGHYEDRHVTSGYWQEYEEQTWVPARYE